MKSVYVVTLLLLASLGFGCASSHRGGVFPTAYRGGAAIAKATVPKVVARPIVGVSKAVAVPTAKVSAPVVVPVAKGSAAVAKAVLPPVVISHPVKVVLVGRPAKNREAKPKKEKKVKVKKA